MRGRGQEEEHPSRKLARAGEGLESEWMRAEGGSEAPRAPCGPVTRSLLARLRGAPGCCSPEWAGVSQRCGSRLPSAATLAGGKQHTPTPTPTPTAEAVRLGHWAPQPLGAPRSEGSRLTLAQNWALLWT